MQIINFQLKPVIHVSQRLVQIFKRLHKTISHITLAKYNIYRYILVIWCQVHVLLISPVTFCLVIPSRKFHNALNTYSNSNFPLFLFIWVDIEDIIGNFMVSFSIKGYIKSCQSRYVGNYSLKC